MKLAVVRLIETVVIEVNVILFAHGHLHIRRDAHIGQADIVGRVIGAAGKGNGTAVRQVVRVLEIALAAGLCADDLAGIVFLNGRGKEFRGGIGVLIDKNRDGQVNAIRVRIVDLRLAVVVFHAEQWSLRQQIIQNLHQLALIATGVVTDVK